MIRLLDSNISICFNVHYSFFEDSIETLRSKLFGLLIRLGLMEEDKPQPLTDRVTIKVQDVDHQKPIFTPSSKFQSYLTNQNVADKPLDNFDPVKQASRPQTQVIQSQNYREDQDFSFNQLFPAVEGEVAPFNLELDNKITLNKEIAKTFIERLKNDKPDYTASTNQEKYRKSVPLFAEARAFYKSLEKHNPPIPELNELKNLLDNMERMFQDKKIQYKHLTF